MAMMYGTLTDLSLILLVRSTASMSMRILYLTCGGTLAVQGNMSKKTTPAQNLFSSSRYKAWWIIWDSSVWATNLSRLMHYDCEKGRKTRQLHGTNTKSRNPNMLHACLVALCLIVHT